MKQTAFCSCTFRIAQGCCETAGQLLQEPSNVPSGWAGCGAGVRARAGEWGAAGKAEWEHPMQEPCALQGDVPSCVQRDVLSLHRVPVGQAGVLLVGAAGVGGVYLPADGRSLRMTLEQLDKLHG